MLHDLKYQLTTALDGRKRVMELSEVVKIEPMEMEASTEKPGDDPGSSDSEHELVVDDMKEEPYDIADMVKTELVEASTREPEDDPGTSDSEHELVMDFKEEPYDVDDSSQYGGNLRPATPLLLESSTSSKIKKNEQTKFDTTKVTRSDTDNIFENVIKIDKDGKVIYTDKKQTLTHIDSNGSKKNLKKEFQMSGEESNSVSDHIFSCETCKQCFSAVNKLDDHILSHTNEKPYQCHVCKKSFEQQIDCDTHICRTHTGKKRTRCNVCKKKFTCKSDLTKHMRIHTGEKPFQCNVCKKSFNQKCHLDAHALIHTGEKPYQCDVCQKRFGRSGDLRLHMTLHSDERAYQCSMCEKAFNHRGNLNSHIRKVHKMKPVNV